MVRYRPGSATFLAWLDCRDLGIPDTITKRGLVSAGEGPASVFLDKGRVALSAGNAFGTGGAGHVRLNLATSSEILTEAVRRMTSGLDC